MILSLLISKSKYGERSKIETKLVHVLAQEKYF